MRVSNAEKTAKCRRKYEVERSLEKYKGKENIDFVTCAICGKRGLYIDSRHLETRHHMTREEYIRKFPKSQMNSKKKLQVQSRPNNKTRLGKKNSIEQNRKISKSQKGKNNSFYGKCHPVKILRKMYKFKDYTFPSGKVVRIQGYEYKTLDFLIDIGVRESDIIVGMENVPKISYKYRNNKHIYFPDCYIKSLNTIIETKSTWTFRHGLYKNIAKMEACRKKGYGFQFYIW